MTTFVTQSSDSVVASGSALSFQFDAETVTVLVNVLLFAKQLDGVSSTFDDSTLVNRGMITGFEAGVSMTGLNDATINLATGLISSGNDGIDAVGSDIQSVRTMAGSSAGWRAYCSRMRRRPCR
jgi:hypothetical protein